MRTTDGPGKRVYRLLPAAATALLLVLGVLLVRGADSGEHGTGGTEATVRSATTPGVVTGDGGDRPAAQGRAADSSPGPGARSITLLLAKRARAVNDEDRAAFLRTIDPGAEPHFRRAQRRLFDNLAELPLRSWRYVVDRESGVRRPAAPPGAPAAEYRAPGVRLLYRLWRVDDEPVQREMGYLFARRAGQWYLLSDTAVADRGHQTWRGVWDYGRVRSLTSDRGLVLYHPQQRLLARRVTDQLDAAVGAVTAIWGSEWSRRVGVLIPNGDAEMSNLAGPDFDIDGIAGIAIAEHVDEASGSVRGQRIVLNPTVAAGIGDAALSTLLIHELTHVATRGKTAAEAPLWLLEGAADYTAYAERDPSTVAGALRLSYQRGWRPGHLPGQREFAGRGSDLDLIYQRAWSLIEAIEQRYSQPIVVRLYDRIAGDAAAGRGAGLDAALGDVLGTDRAGLLRMWRSYLAESLSR